MKMKRLLPWICAVCLSLVGQCCPPLAQVGDFLALFLVAAACLTPGGADCLRRLGVHALVASVPYQNRVGEWLFVRLTHRQRWFVLWAYLAVCSTPALANAILKTHLAPVMSLPNVITLLVSWSSVVGVVVWGACQVTHLQAYVLEKKVEWAGRMIDG